MEWDRLLDGVPAHLPGATAGAISFATSRPPEDLFPLDKFRAVCNEVMAAPDFARVLQLGSPSGYEPLRDYLFERARLHGEARSGDDILITNGCQQALDLLCRAMLRAGDRVAIEDAIYPGQ